MVLDQHSGPLHRPAMSADCIAVQPKPRRDRGFGDKADAIHLVQRAGDLG